MRAKDRQEVIDLFIENVYGENKELAMASFNEIEALRTANELFAERNAEIARLNRVVQAMAALERLVNGIEEWNRVVEGIIGRSVEYEWGDLADAKRILARYRERRT